jgi:hypothetical protein
MFAAAADISLCFRCRRFSPPPDYAMFSPFATYFAFDVYFDASITDADFDRRVLPFADFAAAFRRRLASLPTMPLPPLSLCRRRRHYRAPPACRRRRRRHYAFHFRQPLIIRHAITPHAALISPLISPASDAAFRHLPPLRCRYASHAAMSLISSLIFLTLI